jgi:hypothetical protein
LSVQRAVYQQRRWMGLTQRTVQSERSAPAQIGGQRCGRRNGLSGLEISRNTKPITLVNQPL